MTSEPQPRLMTKVVQWLRRHVWLLIGGFIALAWVQSSADHAETPAMARNRAAIEGMSRTERDLVRHNEQLYHDLSPSMRRDVRRMHDAIEADVELRQTLAQWHEWLASLSFEAREKVLGLSDLQERLAMVRHLRQPGPPSAIDLLNRKYSLLTNLRTSIVGQRFTDEHFQSVIRTTARFLEMSESPLDSSPEALFAYHTMVVRRLMERARLESQRHSLAVSRGPLKLTFPPGLRDELLSELGKNAERLVGAQSPSFFMIYIVGLYAEAGRLARELRPSDDEWFELNRQVEQQLRSDQDGKSREELLEELEFEWLRSRLPDLVPAAEFLQATMMRLRSSSRYESRPRPGLDGRPER